MIFVILSGMSRKVIVWRSESSVRFIFEGEEVERLPLSFCIRIVHGTYNIKVWREFIFQSHFWRVGGHSFLNSLQSVFKKEKKQDGLSAKEYKKKMEQEKVELNKKLEDTVKEYNELADWYNKLIDDKAELERKNRERDYEVIYQQEHSR